MGERRYIALICSNGHVIRSTVGLTPEQGRDFCEMCGAATIIACQKCNAPIPGLSSSEIVAGAEFSTPAYCANCGTPYPWTEKGLEVARELVSELEDLTEDERALLAKDLDDIIADTPRTMVAATRWKKALSKISKEVAHAFREIFIDIASETAKKQLGL